MELKKIKEMFKDKIEGFYEVIKIYEININGLDETLKIKVIKYVGDNNYYGISNLYVQGKGCATPYRSIKITNTEEDAVFESVNGFFAFYSSEAKITKDEDW